MNIKGSGFGVLSLVVLMTSFVSASSHSTSGVKGGRMINDLFNNIGDFFTAAFSGSGSTALSSGSSLITSFAFAALIYFLVYMVVNDVWKSSSSLMRFGISASITLLAFFGIPAGFLGGISTAYGALGATLLVAIPFIIVMWFSLRTNNLFIARLTWAIFGIYFFASYLSAAVDVGTFLDKAQIPNLVGVVIGLVAFFAIPSIRELVMHGNTEALRQTAMTRAQRRAAGMEALDANIEAVTGVETDPNA